MGLVGIGGDWWRLVVWIGGRDWWGLVVGVGGVKGPSGLIWIDKMYGLNKS